LSNFADNEVNVAILTVSVQLSEPTHLRVAERAATLSNIYVKVMHSTYQFQTRVCLSERASDERSKEGSTTN
jgi:hypothetical protein